MRAGVALDPADARQELVGEALPRLSADLASPPTLRQPDLPPSHDQLEGEQHRDHLEDVGHATGGQRQRRRIASSSTKSTAKLFSWKTSIRLPIVFGSSPRSQSLQPVAELLPFGHPLILLPRNDERPGVTGALVKQVRNSRDALGGGGLLLLLALGPCRSALAFSAFASGVSSSAWRPMRSSLAITRRWICDVPS